MSNSEDEAIRTLLTRQWQAPAASPEAVGRLLTAAKAAPPRSYRRGGWLLPGAAVAATLFAGLWLAVPGERDSITPGTALSASLTNEDMMSYVFATYPLEETF